MAVDRTGLSASMANVAGAIRRAAQATGASFDYLLATAKVESNLNPNVKAASSSATGLFQFIEQTWLATLKRAGPALGYGNVADAIVQTPAGGYAVADPAMRNAVLNLRRDPATNAAMAGAFTQHNSAELRERLGRAATGGELYIAHFLGASGAAKLIAHAANRPDTPAAELFPAAADANRSIFYDRRGRSRSAAEVYGTLVQRFETARMHTAALAGQAPATASHRTAAAVAASDPAGTFDALAMVSAVPIARTAPDASAFHSLFHTEGRRQPISPLLGAIWGGNSPSGMSEPAAGSRPAPVRAAEQREGVDLRGLYQNGRLNIRGLFDGTS
jgi:hypothetical protein